MVKLPTFPNLEGLADLACRDAVDIRPTLLRVLTDLYVQKPSHTADEEHHYAELALRLIEAVGPAVKAAIAAKLATYPRPPRAVVERLAREGHAMTDRTSQYGSCLTAINFKAMIDRLGPLCENDAAGECEIADCDPDLTENTLLQSAEPGIMIDHDAVLGDAIGSPPPHDAPTARELMALFFEADSTERELILMAAEFVSADLSGEPHRLAAPDTLRRLEISALTHQRHIFLRELGLALELSRPLVEQIVDDTLGEPILVAAKALGMRADMLQRILLFLNPTVGHSVRRVYDLARLYEQIVPAAAAVQVKIWKAADPRGDRPTAENLPHRPLSQLRPDAVQPARPQVHNTERRMNES
jgi:hypothetical protein